MILDILILKVDLEKGKMVMTLKVKKFQEIKREENSVLNKSLK
jgi:hypothetical protein